MPPAFTQLRVSAEHRPISRGETITLWLVGLVFAGLLGASLFEQYVPQKLSILFFVVFWFAMLLLHEAGHALMARAVGWRVSEMVIGFGPLLWRGRIGATRVRLHLIPIEGYVLPGPISSHRARLKTALVYAAGPGIELLLLAGMIAWFGTDMIFGQSDSVGRIALKTLAIVIIWGAGFNLLPFTTQGGVSDGLGIILSPFMTDATVAARLIALELREVDRLEDAARFDEGLAILARVRERFVTNVEVALREARLHASAGRFAAARTAMDRVLDGRALLDITQINILHTEALVEMARPQQQALNIDLALNRALQLAPDHPTLLVTKGGALIARGRNEDGGNLIADAFMGLDDPVDRARALGYLAVAASRCRQEPAARRFYSAFIHLNRSQPFAQWVDRAMTPQRAA